MHTDRAPAFAPNPLTAPRRRGPRCRQEPSPPPPEAGSYLQACREVEAARLLLAELGRRHGPMD